MDKQHYEEMVSSLTELENEGSIQGKRIYIFGHCNATEELVDLFIQKGYRPIAILDNNKNKHGRDYKGVTIIRPDEILMDTREKTIVCVVARAYASMSDQLKRLGYKGQIIKLVDYNSYADYSLSVETIARMRERVERGTKALDLITEKYPGYFKVLCPFQALGDIYFMMSYLPYFLKKRGKKKCVICVIGNACSQVVKLYFDHGSGNVTTAAGNCEYAVERSSQKEIDELIQAAIYTRDQESYIAHQDRPYVNNLSKALYSKKISLEQIYCCGVFGLPKDTVPVLPTDFAEYGELGIIPKNNAVILSPYAKSVTALSSELWKDVVSYYKKLGKTCFTNVIGDEKPLEGTVAIRPKINEMQAVVERAGCFVGIRSGMCDILRTANAVKTALFPDYHYCDTQWKSIDMYYMDGWNNIVVKDGFRWEDAICRN